MLLSANLPSKVYNFFLLLLLLRISATAQNSTGIYQEKYRPQFHFTPAKNWTNDPNGLVYFKGEYHLFYQYNPQGNRWGHMSWGHAVSKDLVHWQHLPLAIPEKDSIMIFSGSCVIDENNTSGFAKSPGQIPMVAIYTAHIISNPADADNYRQEQHIAYSLDHGRTWTKYSGNPVLDIHKKDFRDPKVFWYAPGKKWVMALVLPHEHKVQLYSSHNLKSWEHLSDFGPAGDTKDIWECSDLFEVPVEGKPGKKKWVLFNSQQVTVQYFAGEFDGKIFHNENPADKIYRQDYGPDYYAVVTFNHLPASQKPVSIGWANNWTYANDIPTWPWKSAMSLPRALSVKRINNEWVLLQQPVAALSSLRGDQFTWKGNLNGKRLIPFKGQSIEMDISFSISKKSIAGVNLAVGNNNWFTIGYDAERQQLFIDRSHAGDTAFTASFSQLSKYEAPLPAKNGHVHLHVYFDKSIIEVYANEGEVVLTTQLFTNENNDGIEIFSNKGPVEISYLRAWKLKSAWHR